MNEEDFQAFCDRMLERRKRTAIEAAIRVTAWRARRLYELQEKLKGLGHV